MKRIVIALLATAAAIAANTASAETRVRIGVNVGAPVYRSAPPAVVYAPPPAVVYAPAHAPVIVTHAPRGYWKEVPVKTWIPERHVIRHNRWGRAERVCEPGYFTIVTQRVWVDTDRHDHRNDRYSHHDRHDRRHDNGNHYGHDRNNSASSGWRR